METNTMTANLISKQPVIDALQHVMDEGKLRAAFGYWNISMSPEQQGEFDNSYTVFESCVRRRYNVMTGGTL